MRSGLLALLLFAASGCASAPAPESSPETERADPSETVETVLARFESAVASNDASFQIAEVSRDFAPSYDGILDQIRASVLAYDVERIRLTKENYAQDRDGKTLVVDARFDLRRRNRSAAASESAAGSTRLRFRLEGGRYRLIGQEGDPLLGRP